VEEGAISGAPSMGSGLWVIVNSLLT